MLKIIFKTLVFSVLSVVTLIGSSAYAAVDLEMGEKKAAQCASCHGVKGLSSFESANPSLAGQSALYLVNQLNAFKTGARVNPIMQSMAAGLSEADIGNLAAYFASLPHSNSHTAMKTPTDGAAKFAMCAGCHGSAGEGRGGYPRLAGQNPDYVAAQLQAFKTGVRKGGAMPAMAAHLSEEDIKTLSVYVSTLKK
jgi:cytochrome c553